MLDPRIAILSEAAGNLQEFNIRGALDALKKFGSELKKHFQRGYQRGKLRPWDGEPTEPKADKKKKSNKKSPEKKTTAKKTTKTKEYDPTSDPNAVRPKEKKPATKKYGKKGKPKKPASSAAKRKEKTALLKRLKATDFSPAPKAKNKMRAKKPGGGYLYLSKDEYSARFGRKKPTKAAPKAAKRKAKSKAKRKAKRKQA